MKRIVIYAMILIMVWALPVKRLDISKLSPVEVLSVEKVGSGVVLKTDTGEKGVGRTAVDALSQMRSTSGSVIYLDTAEYLLVGEDAAAEADALRKELKTNVKLCGFSAEADLKAAAQYLNVHGDLPSMREWNVSDPLPVMGKENGRFKILDNHENNP